MGDQQAPDKRAADKEVWRGDISSGKAGGKSLGEYLLGNAATAEEIAAVLKAHPEHQGPILGAVAARFGNSVATKALELADVKDHSAAVYGREAMASSCDVDDTAVDKTASDPGAKLPFDAKGGWDGAAIARKLGQHDKIGGTDNDAQRCTFANLLTTKVLAGPAATKAYCDSVYKRVAGESIEIKEGRATAMAAAANSLQAIGSAIEAKTATYGDLSWAQESLYELFADEIGGGTYSAKLTDFLGEDLGTFAIGKELAGSPVTHDVRTNVGCILEPIEVKDWASGLAEGEAYACAWIGPMEKPEAVSHQIMIVCTGGKKYIYDPEVQGDGNHLFPITDSRVKKYFDGGCRIAVTFKVDAPPKPEASGGDKKKGATAAKK